MKIRNLTFIIILLAGSINVLSKTNIAVYGLEAFNIRQADADVLANRLRSILVNLGSYDVVERNRMQEVLEEHGFQQTGCIEDACVMQAGQVLGVEKIIAGSVGKLGQIYTLELRLIDVKSARIEASSNYDHRGVLEDLLTSGVRIALEKLLHQPIDDKIAEVITEGVLVIDTDPPYANVLVDGAYIGKSPLEFTFQADTPLLLNVDGGETHDLYSETITLTAGDTIRKHIKLNPTYGTVKVIVNEPTSLVFIDQHQIDVSSAPEMKLTTGIHQILIKMPTYYPYNETFVIRKNKRTSLDIQLKSGLKDLNTARLKTKWTFCGTLIMGALTATSALMAEHTYQEYEKATDSDWAMYLKEHTRILDNRTLVGCGLTLCMSSMTFSFYSAEKHLKVRLGIN